MDDSLIALRKSIKPRVKIIYLGMEKIVQRARLKKLKDFIGRFSESSCTV